MNSIGKRKVNAFSDLLKNKKTKKFKLWTQTKLKK
jgi:hypothetical protein